MLFFTVFIFLLAIPLALAHVGEEVIEEVPLLQDPIIFIQATTVLIIISVLVSIFFRGRLTNTHKKILFFIIAAPVIFTTAYLAGDTIYLNLVSETGGPIHWHADFEIWACGEKIELAPPESAFENKVGTAVIHHHSDDRIHIEGALRKLQDAELGVFFRLIGGDLTQNSITMNTPSGLETWKNGDSCPDGSGALQVFVYKTILDVYSQEKLEDPAEYIISPHSNAPPGDCIIIEFDSQIKERTNKICPSYAVAIERGDIHGG